MQRLLDRAKIIANRTIDLRAEKIAKLFGFIQILAQICMQIALSLLYFLSLTGSSVGISLFYVILIINEPGVITDWCNALLEWYP